MPPATPYAAKLLQAAATAAKNCSKESVSEPLAPLLHSMMKGIFGELHTRSCRSAPSVVEAAGETGAFEAPSQPPPRQRSVCADGLGVVRLEAAPVGDLTGGELPASTTHTMHEAAGTKRIKG